MTGRPLIIAWKELVQLRRDRLTLAMMVSSGAPRLGMCRLLGRQGPAFTGGRSLAASTLHVSISTRTEAERYPYRPSRIVASVADLIDEI